MTNYAMARKPVTELTMEEMDAYKTLCEALGVLCVYSLVLKENGGSLMGEINKEHIDELIDVNARQLSDLLECRLVDLGRGNEE